MGIYGTLKNLTTADFNSLIQHFQLLKDLDKQTFINSSNWNNLLQTKNKQLGVTGTN
jgi:hypothetical protein